MTDDKKTTPDFGPIWSDQARAARSAQVDYGRWIINTLWLMHSGAIAGLLAKWDAKGLPPKPVAIVLFAVGVVLAFGAAAAAWFNFTTAATFFIRYLYGGERWFDVNNEQFSWWMGATMKIAVGCILASVLCLIAGVVVALNSD